MLGCLGGPLLSVYDSLQSLYTKAIQYRIQYRMREISLLQLSMSLFVFFSFSES